MGVKKVIPILLVGMLGSCSPKMSQQSSVTTAVENKNIDWEGYSDDSSFGKDEIKVEHLQGEWSAYKGVYKFEEHLNAMKLDKPFIIEVKDDTFRRSKDSAFEKFEISQNLISQQKATKAVTGIINKLTENELTITWKDGENYTRYYYEK